MISVVAGSRTLEDSYGFLMLTSASSINVDRMEAPGPYGNSALPAVAAVAAVALLVAASIAIYVMLSG